MSAVPVIEETGEITRKQSLFDITEEFQAIYDTYWSLEGAEADDFLSKALENALDATGDKLNQKLDAYCSLIAEAKARADVRKAEADRLKKLAEIDENFAARLKDRLKEWFAVTGNTKIETPFHKIGVQANGGVLPVRWLRVVDGEPVETEVEPDVSEVDDKFLAKVLDTDAIRTALGSGEELPFAKLGVRGSHVRIR